MSRAICTVGVDPGTSHVGIAVVSLDFGGEASLVWFDTRHPRNVRQQTFVDVRLAQGASFSAIEVPEGRNNNPGIKYLGPTALLAGQYGAWCMSSGMQNDYVFPRVWKSVLTGKHNADKKTIKASLKEYVAIPRTNDHVRDAIAVALVAAHARLFGAHLEDAMNVAA